MGLTKRGELFELARNNVVLAGQKNGFVGDFRFQEWAGACFSPCGRWLFVKIQTPGMTFAVTGPGDRVAFVCLRPIFVPAQVVQKLGSRLGAGY